MREAFSLRSGPLLIAAGVIALALVFMLNHPRAGAVHAAPKAAQRPASQVIVASHPIAAGAVFSATDIRAENLEGEAPAGAVFSRDSVIGRVASHKITAGETLLQADLSAAAALGIAMQVPQGERAFSIRVTEDEIVGGLLQSGDHVDLFATIPGSVFPASGTGHGDRSQAVLLLQDVQVLAVGENAATRGAVQASARTVTLSLPPAELARLALALRVGKVSLAVRKPGDNDLAGSADATLADLVAPVVQNAPARRSHGGIPFYAGARGSVALADGRP